MPRPVAAGGVARVGTLFIIGVLFAVVMAVVVPLFAAAIAAAGRLVGYKEKSGFVRASMPSYSSTVIIKMAT